MVPGLPPGPGEPWNLPGFASTEVPPVMLTAVASMRGRTNSLVIIELNIKKEDPKVLLYICEIWIT
jgi:hypothetical protein